MDSYQRKADHFFSPCTEAELLPRTIGAFKTLGLRDLGHSNPYMHNGQFDTLESVLQLYIQTSSLAREGRMRNASPDLKAIAINARDVASLASFLRALNEDYN